MISREKGNPLEIKSQYDKKRDHPGPPHATATHSISISNSIGQDATGTKLRAGGLTLKYLA